MTTISKFEGFPKKGFKFLKDLKANNNREWFNANKQVYTVNVLSPAQSFVNDLGEKISKTLVNIRYDTRATGSGSLMRIHRDIRFSKDKTPYRTRVGIIFWEGPGKKMEHSGFFIGLEPKSAVLHAGMHMFTKQMLPKYREAIIDEKTGKELDRIIVKLNKSGYAIGGSKYKRVPRGFDPDHERAELLLSKGLYASHSDIPREIISSPDFIEYSLKHIRAMSPLHNWLVERDLS
ncbi:MAG: DUF2461 domain-containing protein [Candidatus Thorarchaeota archaeon]|jgi:uncharacterized protein (TIGR02453 family)